MSLDDEYGAYYHTLFDRAIHEWSHNMIRESSSRRHTMKKEKDYDSSTTQKFDNTIKQNSISVKKEEDNEESITRIEKSSNGASCGGIMKRGQNPIAIKKEENREEGITKDEKISNVTGRGGIIKLKPNSVSIKKEEDIEENIMNSENSSLNDGADSDTMKLEQKSISIKQEEDTIQN